MPVLGGETKSIIGRVAEIVGWWPLLLALFVVGGASAVQSSGVDTPTGSMPSSRFTKAGAIMRCRRPAYISARSWRTSASGGIALLGMLVRRTFSFLLTIASVVAVVAVAWLVVHYTRHA